MTYKPNDLEKEFEAAFNAVYGEGKNPTDEEMRRLWVLHDEINQEVKVQQSPSPIKE